MTTLRYSGIGIFVAYGSNWNLAAPLRGPTQQNDKAELVAAVLLVEAVSRQVESLGFGILLLIDNKWVCDNIQSILDGNRPSPVVSHWDWWARVYEAAENLPSGFIECKWVPSHCTDEDVASGKISAVHREMNAGADQMAARGCAMNAPARVDFTAPRRRLIKTLHALQRMIADVLVARKDKEKDWITKAKEAIQSTPVSATPVQQGGLSPFMEFRDSFPDYCIMPGGEPFFLQVDDALKNVNPLRAPFPHIAIDAVKWYWARLAWPAVPSPLNKGATWLELCCDFVAATGVRCFNKSHSSRTHLSTVAEAFAALTRALADEAASPIFSGEVGRITPLAPLGPKNAMWGLSVAPFFLRQTSWAPLLASRFAGARDARGGGFPVSLIEVPVPCAFNPLGSAFERALAR